MTASLRTHQPGEGTCAEGRIILHLELTSYGKEDKEHIRTEWQGTGSCHILLTALRIKRIEWIREPSPEFPADWISGEVDFRDGELVEYRWATCETMPENIPDPMSIARRLIEDWRQRKCSIRDSSSFLISNRILKWHFFFFLGGQFKIINPEFGHFK